MPTRTADCSKKSASAWAWGTTSRPRSTGEPTGRWRSCPRARRAAPRNACSARVEDTCQRAAQEGFSSDELLRARKKLRYRYASLAESRFDRALALAEGTLSGFPLPEVAERIVSRMGQAEVEAAWRNVLQGRTLTTILAD